MSKDRPVSIGLVQMSMEEDGSRNLSKALRMIKEASERGAKLVCLPELFSNLYFPRVRNAEISAESIPGLTTRALSRAAKENKVVLIGGSIYEKSKDKFYNSSPVFDQTGRMLGKYRKVHIPQDEYFYEQDYFSPGKEYKVFKTSYARAGVLICFDQWYPEPARAYRLLGAEVLFYPTAIGTVRGIGQTEGDWREAWESVQRGHAISNSMIVASVNRTGVEGGTRFWGGSFVCDQFGKIISRAGEGEQVLLAECDLNLGTQIEEGWGFLRNRKPETYRKLIS